MAESHHTEIHQIATIVHGRYLVERGTTAEDPPLLVGFHGYGENASAHLEKLRQIPGAGSWLLCAVQAPHPFYTKKGDVVASWMTKQDRELAIDDNIRYAASVVAELRRTHGHGGPLVYAGFSQGVAMAWRAAVRSGHPCQGLIALAGDVPPEVASTRQATVPPVLLGRGTDDAWYTEAVMAKDLETLATLGAEVTPCVFEGGHDWYDPFYAAAGDFLAQAIA